MTIVTTDKGKRINVDRVRTKSKNVIDSINCSFCTLLIYIEHEKDKPISDPLFCPLCDKDIFSRIKPDLDKKKEEDA